MHVQESLRAVDPEGYKLRKAESKKLRRGLGKEAALNNMLRMITSVATLRGPMTTTLHHAHGLHAQLAAATQAAAGQQHHPD